MSVQPGEVIRCAVRQVSASGTDIVNVYHFQNVGSNDTPDANVLADMATYMDVAYANINAQVPGSQQPVDIKIDVVELIGGVVKIVRNIGTISWGVTYNPTGSGESYALGVALGIILRTLVGKVFGRKFIGQLSETTVNGNSLATGTPTTNFTAFAAAIVGDATLGADVYHPGVLSTRTLTFEEFVQADIATEVFYQRRRAIRMGS